MPDRAAILALIPHQGAMCLLDRVVSWDDTRIRCETRSHLDASNPLRADGRLGVLCGCEYGMQAAALHGALRTGTRPQAGRVAALRVVLIAVPRLDDPAFDTLTVEAEMQMQNTTGLIYTFHLHAQTTPLLSGRGTIALPAGNRGA